jgi:hypothetical protein
VFEELVWECGGDIDCVERNELSAFDLLHDISWLQLLRRLTVGTSRPVYIDEDVSLPGIWRRRCTISISTCCRTCPAFPLTGSGSYSDKS